MYQFGKEFEEFQSNEPYPYLLNQIPEAPDFLAHVDDNCNQEARAREDAASSQEYQTIQQYFYDNYLDDLSELVGEAVEASEMKDVCSYIYWA
mmetsp:Transcript_33087/g.32214  ORF Transcript_33087/g.32214 Transcript_33087/m.32214 type:complete len:93 (+) Transcript_33087:326-604(+)